MDMTKKKREEYYLSGLPWWLSGREFICQCSTWVFHLWFGKIPWRMKWQLTPVFWPGKSMDRGAWGATVYSFIHGNVCISMLFPLPPFLAKKRLTWRTDLWMHLNRPLSKTHTWLEGLSLSLQCLGVIWRLALSVGKRCHESSSVLLEKRKSKLPRCFWHHRSPRKQREAGG